MKPRKALFQKLDCVQIRVPDLASGLAFYCDSLGHHLIWRTEHAAGLQMPGTDTELVLQTERVGLEVDFLVDNADQAAEEFVVQGGSIVVAPFEIAIGRCVVVSDPWGTHLVLLDTSKGLLKTDSEKWVIPTV